MKKTAVIVILLSAVLVLTSCITVNINTGDTKEAETTNAEQTTAAETQAETAEQTAEATTAADTEVEQTEQERLAEFYKSYAGYWSNSENWDFIWFGNENGENRVTFGVWNAGGPFPSGTVTSVTKTGDNSYLLKISIDAVPENDENGGWEAYETELPLTDVSENGITRISARYLNETEYRTFMYHKEAENPFVGGL